MTMKAVIEKCMHEIAEESASQIVSDLNDDTVLLSSGLSSFGFAVLVVRLEDELGFDPFIEMEEAVYPRTFGELVQVYENRGTE